MTRYNKYHKRKASSAIRKISIVVIVLTVFLISISGYTLALASSLTNYTYHKVVVQQGDTLWGLAVKSNTRTDINSVVHKTMQYNNLASTYIQPGQVIYVPTRL